MSGKFVIPGSADKGGYLEELVQWRKEVALGKLLGPRIVAAGSVLDGPGHVQRNYITVANETEGRQAVVFLKQHGADFVKVSSLVPRDVYFAIADEAKKQGLPLAEHVPISVTAAEVSDAGQKSMEHLLGVLLTCSTSEAELRKELMASVEKSVTKRVVGRPN